MDKKDGGSIDLESLRLMVLRVLDYEIGTIPGDSRDYGPQRELDVADLEGARDKVAEAFAELTARRARDEDVAGLGEALVKISDHIRATDPCPDFGWIEAIATEALAPFTGAKP